MKCVARILSVLLVVVVALPLLADEKDSKKVPALQTQTLKRLQSAELTEEQIGKIKELVGQYNPKLMAARKKANDAVPRAQKKARREALKVAKEQGKKLVFAYKLTPEQQEAYDAAQKETKSISGEFNKAVMALLSDEQKAKLPSRKNRKKKSDQ